MTRIQSEGGVRQCGSCTLCCKLVPVRELAKPAGVRCKHQRHGQGCTVYQTRKMPPACQLWSCRWLSDPGATAGLPRPDRSGYVVDMMPDYVELVFGGERSAVEVVQVWCDPKRPQAWRDPALRRYLEALGERGVAAIIRFDSAKAVVVIPPALAQDREWHEVWDGLMEAQRSPEALLDGLARARCAE